MAVELRLRLCGSVLRVPAETARVPIDRLPLNQYTEREISQGGSRDGVAKTQSASTGVAGGGSDWAFDVFQAVVSSLHRGTQYEIRRQAISNKRIEDAAHFVSFWPEPTAPLDTTAQPVVRTLRTFQCHLLESRVRPLKTQSL